MKRVYLKTPEVKELFYRQKWMMDPETMSYNAGYDMEMMDMIKCPGQSAKQMSRCRSGIKNGRSLTIDILHTFMMQR